MSILVAVTFAGVLLVAKPTLTRYTAQIIAFTNEKLDEFGNDEHEIALSSVAEMTFQIVKQGGDD